jgi:hypothetical protein
MGRSLVTETRSRHGDEHIAAVLSRAWAHLLMIERLRALAVCESDFGAFSFHLTT